MGNDCEERETSGRVQLSSRSLPSHLHRFAFALHSPSGSAACLAGRAGRGPGAGRVRLRPNRGFPRRLACDVTSQNQSTSRSRPVRPLSDRKTGHCHPRFLVGEFAATIAKTTGKAPVRAEPHPTRSFALPAPGPRHSKNWFKTISIRVHSCPFAVKSCSCSTCACAIHILTLG